MAQALGYSNTRKALLDHVDEEDKLDGVTIRDAIGRIQKIVVINESGLYALILLSKLPQAFKASVLWSWPKKTDDSLMRNEVELAKIKTDDSLLRNEVELANKNG
ncbi:MAG: Bro-N domain-containing protein [Bacteroidaceae bacterium]|nr:Bro-N domain-containing protein [Bacteroidaceae bacterium]